MAKYIYIDKEEWEEHKRRVRKLEDYFFAAKVLSSAIVATSIFIGYIVKNYEYYRDLTLTILGSK